MNTLEFKSKYKNNHFEVPKNVQFELEKYKDKSMKVIVYINDSEMENNQIFKSTATESFLAGYDDLDSIYDVN